MADYLLDTNILSYWYDTTAPEHARVVARVNEARLPDPSTGYISRFFVSVITLGEIEYGARASHTLTPDPIKQAEYAAKDADRRRFIEKQCPSSLELMKHIASEYGEMKAWLFNNCAPKRKRSKKLRIEELVSPTTGKELEIDENDLWIAAHAKTLNLVLVTHDSRGNLKKVIEAFFETLKVEDWAQ